MVRTYSLKADGATRLSAHFRVREFAEAGTDRVLIDDELVERLEKLHSHLQCSKIRITSGFRTDSTTSQHAKGKAADINCWHMVDGREERYQGREILLAAEDVGFRGIGWIAGSAASRAGVHADTREKAYFFDEADGNRSIGNSWYTYFGLPVPGEPEPSPVGNPYPEPAALLKEGSRGSAVKWVQWQLANVAAFTDVEVDGIFGGKTDAGVRAVQKAAGLEADGIVGPDTIAALKSPGAGGVPAGNPYAEPTGLLRSGSQGEGVKWVQWHLNRLGHNVGTIDGIFGAKTDAGVRAVQKAAGLKADGIVGPDTRTALKNSSAGDLPENNPYPEPTGLLRSGSRGEGVKWVQWHLNRQGHNVGTVDGICGAKTDAGVRAVQKAAGLKVDGIVGPDTRTALKK